MISRPSFPPGIRRQADFRWHRRAVEPRPTARFESVAALKHRIQNHPRRSRVLRPEDRHQASRRHRTPLATLHRSIRFQPSPALRSRIRRRRRHTASSRSWSTAPSTDQSNASSASSSNTTRGVSGLALAGAGGDDPIAERHTEYAEKVASQLRAAGVRVEVDSRNEKMNAKIREHAMQKIPFLLVVGDKESESNKVTSAPAAKKRPRIRCARISSRRSKADRGEKRNAVEGISPRR